MPKTSEWKISGNSLAPDNEDIMRMGTMFQQSNGYMGFRGTLDEYDRHQCVGITLAGLYDRVGNAWREPVNAPNGFYTRVSINGNALHALESRIRQHEHSIDLHDAVFTRDTSMEVDGIQTRIHSRRFLSLIDPHLMCLEFSIECDRECDIEIKTGIDYRVWDLNGTHLEDYRFADHGGTVVLEATTQEQKKTLLMAVSLETESKVSILEEEGVFAQQIRLSGTKNFTFRKYISIYKSDDCEAKDLMPNAIRSVSNARKQGFAGCLKTHQEAWKQRWEATDVTIDGDDEGQTALRFSIFQLLMVAPVPGSGNSIPARALSGQVYKGAIFWDTEFFMFPFFLHTLPEIAEDLLRYRIHTLDGARRKAATEGTGYRGAFYAWESQETGDEACTYFNIGDPFTKRDMRTYFRDKQIHISGDVALAFWDHFQHTGTDHLLREGGLEVILECARFYQSYLYYKTDKQRYEVLDVVGPDEYHERVNNNAFTNRIVLATFQVLLKAIEHFQSSDPAFLETLDRDLGFSKELDAFRDIAEQLYSPAPDPESGLIEQFDGYFKLEDASLEEVKSRKLLPNEYLGTAQGVAAHTQIIKQADVVMMFHRFRSDFPTDIQRINWEYYEPRTEHGSSLSACAYAMVATDCGMVDWAYPYFLKTAKVDLEANYKMYAGTTFIGGSHPAANGGSWMAAIFGFAGLNVRDGAVHLKPRLPSQWNRLSFPIRVRGNAFTVHLSRSTISIEADRQNKSPVSFRIGKQALQVGPGSIHAIPMPSLKG